MTDDELRDECWATYMPVEFFAGKTPLFLDRDGVINVDTNYLHKPDEVQLIPGVAGLISALNQRQVPVIVITNQSGIGRGYFHWADFHATQAEIQRQLGALGARLDAAFACPFHTDGKAPYDVKGHPWRKPKPGMIHAASEFLSVDVSGAWMIGDHVSDLWAAANAGCAAGVLVGGLPAEVREFQVAEFPNGFSAKAYASVEAAAAEVIQAYGSY